MPMVSMSNSFDYNESQSQILEESPSIVNRASKEEAVAAMPNRNSKEYIMSRKYLGEHDSPDGYGDSISEMYMDKTIAKS